ncbi:hypothetical protein KYG33_22335 [Chryseobacterium sp. D764]|jgi:hypothetical protein|uniref:hypothetical protein n=1 Tax=Chryseobacterium sp. D764 TaxID=2856522 RepID=UPI001C57E802|nr:hypothetical protein [Chryseobacterium sp. D764]QXU49453.1 hypothetical protein KYG33_22335 [Chryseobacterium sp. D764]
MMKKILLFSAIVTGSLFFAQKAKVYENSNYSINVPDGWKSTNDSEIINIFPTSQIGAITISEYHDLALSKEEVKKFILALYPSQDQVNKVKDKRSQKGYTEYLYEHFDEKEKLFWITKVFQKDKNLYLVSINCGQKFWNGNYMTQFNETFNSFKIKK